MDKSLLRFYSFVAHVRVTGHFEPAGPWEQRQGWERVKVVTYEVLEHFVGDTVGWFFEDHSGTSCETGFTVGQEWAVFTLADSTGADHASYCTGAQLLRDTAGNLTSRPLAPKGLYQAYVEECEKHSRVN